MIDPEAEWLEEHGDESSSEWVLTFADLMALLLTFFVLMLSYSEVDAGRYKGLAENLASAFSVQSEPSTVTPTAPVSRPAPPSHAPRSLLEVQREQVLQALRGEIDRGALEVETKDQQIIIRIKEERVFESGSAAISAAAEPLMLDISDVVEQLQGSIKVAGHTDNQPISSARFRSNWDLSAARAVTVAEFLMDTESPRPDRFEVSGYADTVPLAPNDTADNRARNRRVEVIVSVPE